MATQDTRNAGNRYRPFRLLALSIASIFLLQASAGCGTSISQTTHPVVPSATPTQQGQFFGPRLPTAQPSALHGPINFLLSTPFSFSSVSGSTTDGNGTITQLDTKAIEKGINGEFKHLLFMVDSGETVKVYNPGTTTPATAQIAQNADGSTAISYTQTTNSEAGSFSITFDGALLENQIKAVYEQQYSPLLISGASSSDVTVAFAAHIRWVSAREIPMVPANGIYHFTNNGGIALSWSASQNAAAYDVYRLIPAQDQQFQLLITVKTSSYNDDSPEAIKNAHTKQGIAYAIFAVGSSGVENPDDIIISPST